MRWFSKSKLKKKQQQQQHAKSPSFTDPPNVYISVSRPQQQQQHPQPLPPRPTTAAPSSSAQNEGQHQPPPPLPPPAGWQQQQQQQPIIVNQHYYLNGQRLVPSSDQPPPPQQQQLYPPSLGCLTGSMVNLAKDVNPLPQLLDDGFSAWQGYSTQLANSTAALYDQVASRFGDVMTLIDLEKLTGNECHLFNLQTPPAETASKSPGKKDAKAKQQQQAMTANMAALSYGASYFSKVELYANSKLPANLSPLMLHMPTWPLICLAAQYSQRVYDSPRGSERDAHVEADWRSGTKAMCIKSVPMDHMGTIVFAIRGTASFMDWAVNLNTAPASPDGFLDDPGNLCHAGFLSVARSMLKPVAARLRQLLEEDPSRCRYSLMITGHSAGGAVAALLYSHMLAETEQAASELNSLTGCFKRVHCVTFGTPPVSLLPLKRPDRPGLQKSLFLSFINEGDPVVRADKAYVRSLLELLALPPPPKPKLKKEDKAPKKHKSIATLIATSKVSSSAKPQNPIWTVPPCSLSNAGRLIVLRSGDPHAKPKKSKSLEERLCEGVTAVTCAEEALRGVVWGDPVCHLMSMYAARVEVLAVDAVTAKSH